MSFENPIENQNVTQEGNDVEVHDDIDSNRLSMVDRVKSKITKATALGALAVALVSGEGCKPGTNESQTSLKGPDPIVQKVNAERGEGVNAQGAKKTHVETRVWEDFGVRTVNEVEVDSSGNIVRTIRRVSSDSGDHHYHSQ